ncbi:2-phospho-L-lactate guanylyltransferase [Xylanimonas sp. McL0601]|uniref:2-phospho-L-lactate guanylyltransferase n=1 Tax=Xylanimonas sp. McL0601 TaxID=3414739 RepID=UPI003CF21F8D
MTDDATRVVAVVPLRDGVSGKSRLAAALAPDERRRLVAELARHVVATLTAVERVERIVIVTADPPFVAEVLAGQSASARISVLPQPGDRPGLNGALDLAREQVRRDAPGTALLVAHADLPALGPDDVAALLAAGRTADVVVATDRHGTGTNLLVLPADAAYDFRFGIGSRAAHEAEAARRGLTAVVVQRPGTAADLDTLDDWDELPAPTRARLAG